MCCYASCVAAQTHIMHTFQATVRVGNNVIRTQVVADNAHDARLLLQQQYGQANIIGFLQQII